MDKMSSNNTYLKYSSFRRLNFWDYYTLSSKSQIKSSYNLVELSEVLTQRKENIIIDNTSIYKRCRVQTRGQGVILRDKVLGKDIKTKKQQVCKEEDFLVAEIDAKVGGYGIVPKYLENAIVSGHYFLFEIDKSKLLPEFLAILVKCDGFSKQVKATGSTNYAAIRPYHVLGYIIPLPSIKEQEQIVKAYNSKIKEAEELEAKADSLENSSEEYLFKSLGIIKQKEGKRKENLSLISYSEISRWSVETLGKTSQIATKFKGKYPLVRLGDFIVSFQYGLSEKSSKEKIGVPMLRMNNIYNSELDLSEESIKYIKIEDSVKEKYRLNIGDLLFNRTNSKELVGKTALFESKGEYTFASYLIRVVLDENKVNRQYINYLFNSSILQYQKDLTSRQITGQANINSQEMQEFLFPLPEINIQEEIANKITDIKNSIKQNQIKATHLRELAIQEFEETIFA